jgi:excisionase family DNA binding protein
MAKSDLIAVVAPVEPEIAGLRRTLGFIRPSRREELATDLLKASETARRLGIPTKELLRLIHERKIRFVMVKGIVPDDAIEEFPAKTS